MKLATLIGWGLAASLLAACSGGAGGVAPSNGSAGNANSGGNSIPQGIAVKINAPFGVGATSTNRRSPDFIGTNVTTIAYTITPGPISGSFASSGLQTFTGCTAASSPVVQTCDITIAPGTYSITVTLKQGATVVGSGVGGPFVVTSGNVTAAAIDINPVNSAPALSIPGVTTQFYNDGQAQTINLTENELDPAGDIITTFYGPVTNYPNLTLTDAGGTTGITLPVPNPITVAPAAVGGNTGLALAYNGTAGNTTTLGVTSSDGTSTSSVSIPYVSLTNNANNPTPGNITFSALGAGGAQSVTVTESTSAASGGLDSHFTSAAGTCAGLATFVPALGSDATSIAGPSATVTYTVTATSAGTPSCTLNVTSQNDANLTNAITINFPGTIGVGVGSHARQ